MANTNNINRKTNSGKFCNFRTYKFVNFADFYHLIIYKLNHLTSFSNVIKFIQIISKNVKLSNFVANFCKINLQFCKNFQAISTKVRMEYESDRQNPHHTLYYDYVLLQHNDKSRQSYTCIPGNKTDW